MVRRVSFVRGEVVTAKTEEMLRVVNTTRVEMSFLYGIWML
jgi:hypothetical protein